MNDKSEESMASYGQDVHLSTQLFILSYVPKKNVTPGSDDDP